MKLDSLTHFFCNLPVIETERMILKPITLDDIDDIYEFTSDPLTSDWLTWYPHKTKTDAINFVNYVQEKYKKNQPAQWAVKLKANNKIIGICGFISFSEEHLNGEVAYVLSPLYWNKGYLTEALKEIIKFSFTQLNLVRIEAKCEIGNLASEKVMQKAGLMQEGIFRKYFRRKGIFRDYKIYSIINEAEQNYSI
ncbi:MAG: GNAT family protein [Bacteroidales bacterium]